MYRRTKTVIASLETEYEKRWGYDSKIEEYLKWLLKNIRYYQKLEIDENSL